MCRVYAAVWDVCAWATHELLWYGLTRAGVTPVALPQGFIFMLGTQHKFLASCALFYQKVRVWHCPWETQQCSRYSIFPLHVPPSALKSPGWPCCKPQHCTGRAAPLLMAHTSFSPHTVSLLLQDTACEI